MLVLSPGSFIQALRLFKDEDVKLIVVGHTPGNTVAELQEGLYGGPFWVGCTRYVACFEVAAGSRFCKKYAHNQELCGISFKAYFPKTWQNINIS